MFIPLGDAPNHTPSRPWVNYGLITINVAVYLWGILAHSGNVAHQDWIQEWGFVPIAPRLETFFTSMFMHAGFVHVAGNMLFLFIFGNNVEGRLGHVGYLLAYLASGLAAVLLFLALGPHSTIPLIGASGAIFGVEGFYFLAFPKNRVRVLVWILLIFWVWVPARIFLGLSFVLNLIYMLTPEGELTGGGVAYAAHVGGFAFGLGLAFLLRVTRPRTEVVTPRDAHGAGQVADLMARAQRALDQRDPATAEALLQTVIRRYVYDPQAPDAALRLGLLQARVLGRPEAARGTLAFAARMHPDAEGRAEALRELGRIT